MVMKLFMDHFVCLCIAYRLQCFRLFEIDRSGVSRKLVLWDQCDGCKIYYSQLSALINIQKINAPFLFSLRPVSRSSKRNWKQRELPDPRSRSRGTSYNTSSRTSATDWMRLVVPPPLRYVHLNYLKSQANLPETLCYKLDSITVLDHPQPLNL